MQLTGQVDDSAPSISNSRSYVCVAFYGWRLKYRFRDHAHGFLFSDWEGKSVFHSLIGDSESHDEVYIRELVSSQIAEIERQYGVIVSSVVTDNAKAMTNAVDSLPEYLDRPLIIWCKEMGRDCWNKHMLYRLSTKNLMHYQNCQ